MLPSLLSRSKTPEYPAAADNKDELCADLGLDTVLNEMAGESPALREAAQRILFEASAVRADDIVYRQEIVQDALHNADGFYALHHTLEAGLAKFEEIRRKNQPGYARFTTAASRLRTAAELSELLFVLAGKVRGHLEGIKANITSAGLRNFSRAFLEFYAGDFIAAALRESRALGQITEGSGMTLGVKLGPGLKGTGYILRSIHPSGKTGRGTKYREDEIRLDSMAIQAKAVELRDAALLRILGVLNTVIAQTAEDLKFLLFELSFYVGCIRLYGKMKAIGLSVCFPSPCPAAADALRFDGLADISLALKGALRPVDNSLNLDRVRLTVVTGANQGGKSTFLRSVGCAQLMAQCGMFAAAKDFHFSIRPRVFTHFCKPEDAGMESGKLDEELARLDHIVDKLEAGALLLMNESFASTAEREGAAIAHEVNGAFYDLQVKVLFVTHLYEYAHAIENEGRSDVRLLRAERRADGRRTFAIRPGLSLPTSYGMDLFRELISDAAPPS